MGRLELAAITLRSSWLTSTAFVRMALWRDGHDPFSMAARFRLMTRVLFGVGATRHEGLAGRDWNESSRHMDLTFHPWNDGRGVAS